MTQLLIIKISKYIYIFYDIETSFISYNLGTLMKLMCRQESV
jgi:hypothetical protein